MNKKIFGEIFLIAITPLCQKQLKVDLEELPDKFKKLNKKFIALKKLDFLGSSSTKN